jgi:hypothetical protein
MSGLEISQWLNWADQDYLASRSLLLRGFVLQGTILANTAIEKYIKTVLTLRSSPFPRGWRGHDVISLYELFASSGGAPKLNKDFLLDLGKAYTLRYPDDLEDGFNISLASIKVLTELDFTVHEIRSGFRITKQSGEVVKTRLDSLIAENSQELMDQNVAFGAIARSQAFGKPTNCLELRVTGGNILAAEYVAGPIPDDRKFNRAGLVPGAPS